MLRNRGSYDDEDIRERERHGARARGRSGEAVSNPLHDACRPPLRGKRPPRASLPGGFPEIPCSRPVIDFDVPRLGALKAPDQARRRRSGRSWSHGARRRAHRPRSGGMLQNRGSYDDEDIRERERHGARARAGDAGRQGGGGVRGEPGNRGRALYRFPRICQIGDFEPGSG